MLLPWMRLLVTDALLNELIVLTPSELSVKALKLAELSAKKSSKQIPSSWLLAIEPTNRVPGVLMN